MHRFPALLFSVFLFSVFSAAAQPRDRTSFTYLYEGSAAVDSGGHIALRETEFRTGYPAWREPDRIVSLGDDTWFARVGLRFH